MANLKVSEMNEATMFDDEDYAMIVQTNQNKKITKQTMFSSVNNEMAKLHIALGVENNTYDPSSTYNIGDLVIYNNSIYECNTAITTAEAWDDSKWTLVPIITNESMINKKLLPQIEDFSSQVTYASGEQANNYSFKKQGNLVTIMYQGQIKAHTQGTKLFSLPAEYMPPNVEYYCTFVKMGGGAVGTIQFVKSNNSVFVNQISSTTARGRVYFSTSYFID